MVRITAVLNVLSVILVIFSLTMLVPLAVSLVSRDSAVSAYFGSAVSTFSAGALVWLATRRGRMELQPRDGFLLVTLVWTVLPAFATLPLLLEIGGLSFTDAYFETVSGMTTTGSTVLSNIENLAPSINFWRCQLQWMGGMGIIVLAVAVLPLLGVGGSQVFRAETPGPMKDTKLTPRITETAKGLWLVYALITLLCVFAMRGAGMSWFDALLHAFTTMSLGGMSSHDASFAYWNSPAIEAVTIFFMLIAGMNFASHFLALRGRSFSAYGRDPEVRPYLGVLILSVIGIAFFLWWHGIYSNFSTALRHAAFNVVSMATTTGHASVDFNTWPMFAPVWMLFLCCFSTCSGSTGSGIKMVRAELMARQTLREFQRIIHPKAIIPVKLGGQAVENKIIFAVLAFMLVYGGSVIAMTMILAASGLDIISSFTAVIASINNTGPGLNQVGPSTNFASLTDFQTWICAIAMLLGRLELFTLIVVVTPGFWRQ